MHFRTSGLYGQRFKQSFIAVVAVLSLASCSKDKDSSGSGDQEPDQVGVTMTMQGRTTQIKAVKASGAVYIKDDNTLAIFGSTAAEDQEGGEVITILLPGLTTGTKNWDDETGLAYITPDGAGGNELYSSQWTDEDDQLLSSPGYVRIDKVGAVGDYVTGSFVVEKASKNFEQGTVKLTGTFKVKRVADE